MPHGEDVAVALDADRVPSGVVKRIVLADRVSRLHCRSRGRSSCRRIVGFASAIRALRHSAPEALECSWQAKAKARVAASRPARKAQTDSTLSATGTRSEGREVGCSVGIRHTNEGAGDAQAHRAATQAQGPSDFPPSGTAREPEGTRESGQRLRTPRREAGTRPSQHSVGWRWLVGAARRSTAATPAQAPMARLLRRGKSSSGSGRRCWSR